MSRKNNKSAVCLFLLLVSCLMSATCHAAGDKTIIKGTIKGVEKGRLLLIANTGESRRDTLGKAEFKAPAFSLTVSVKEPLCATLIVEGYEGGFQFFAEPGAHYDALLTNGADFYIRGGKLQKAYLEYEEGVRQRNSEIKRLQQQYDSLKSAMKYRSASALNDSISKRRTALKAYADKYHADNDNILSAHDALTTAQRKDMRLRGCRQLYDGLGGSARMSMSGRILKERIQRLEKLENGKAAPDFQLPTLDGKTFSLYKMEGKIKIVDFWASWCGPCRLNNPPLKRMYEKYHSKGLEIVSISLDDNRQRWADAVAKDALPWIQVSSLRGWKDETARTYNVTAIPAIFILDEKNHIIARDIRGEALAIFLEDHLNNTK